MNFYDPLVESWLKRFFEERDAWKTTLEEEIADVRGAVRNENVWLQASTNDEEFDMHEANLEAFSEYLIVLLEIQHAYDVVGGENEV